MNNKGVQTVKSKKFNYKKLLIFLSILVLIGLFINYLLNLKITNIYIKGNIFLTDQEIIDISGIKDYPKTLYYTSNKIKNNIQNNDYIYSVKVTKKYLTKVYISIVENYPLFYNLQESKTVLYDGTMVDKEIPITLINSVPNTVYSAFINKMKDVDLSILNEISEIEYKPNDVDKERFLLYMNDGNYVYLTIDKFLRINKYMDVISSFEGKNGILYLDSGEYFEVFE